MNNYKEEIAKLQTQLDELKSKIEKPKTIDEIAHDILAISISTNVIKSYMVNNKQEIIETLNNL